MPQDRTEYYRQRYQKNRLKIEQRRLDLAKAKKRDKARITRLWLKQIGNGGKTDGKNRD